MLRATGLGCERGERMLFEQLEFALGPGGALQVTGPNGSGKSTLLRVLCGLARPDAGMVFWDERPIAELREDYARTLAYLGHADGLKGELLGWENLVVAAGLGGVKLARAKACAALERVGLANAADRPVHQLSQGERRRTALARLLVMPRTIWILDEPFNALDAQAMEIIRNELERHLDRGGLLVFTSHFDAGLPPRAGMHRLNLNKTDAC